MTERAPRDRCRLPAPSRCLDGRVATSVATAARIATADSGLPRGRRALSGALHTDAQVRATQPAERRLQSTSLVPCPDSPPTASSDERVVPRTASPQTGHHEPKIPAKKTTRRNHHQDEEDHELLKTDPLSTRPPNPKNHYEDQDLASCAPLYSSWLLAPPSFELLREASRKGAFPIPNPLAPSPRGARGARESLHGPSLGRFIPPK